MALDVTKLTLGEVAKVEELAGMAISQIGEDNQPKGKVLAALAFVAKRREDPAYSWNDAQDLTFDEANEILGLTEGADDDVPLDESSPEPSASSSASPKKKTQPQS